jgi:C4-dicarboxylate-specific signal transduction histidine kinase
LQDSLATLEETQAQLVQTQKMEAIGRLTAGIAHDFNNLLTPMLWAVHELRCSGADPEQDVLPILQQAVENAAKLTRQLVALGRRQVLAPKKLDLRQVVGESAALLRRALGEDVRVELELADERYPSTLIRPRSSRC